MSKQLVIVESPAKAKTIGSVLGKDYEVVASYGHIRDLPKSEMGVDIEHDFAPTYVSNAAQKKRLNELTRLAKVAPTVWLATDEDREGEAIAWHLAQGLKLEAAKTRRIAFHEITAPAIRSAIAHPRAIDQSLVDAQQARRVLDRLVGYELSPILWKKVQTGLSAGRVQSVALRLVVDREQEIERFKSSASFKVTGGFTTEKQDFEAQLSQKLPDANTAKDLLDRATGGSYTISDLETKPGRRSPAPPFTTSTLQQEASRKLGYSPANTMRLAQRLYEAGQITYMRTDSVHISDLAVKQAGEVITKRYGANYASSRQYTTKTAGAQQAHEAIRPTDLARATISGDPAQAKLYELIWQRALASQMAEARLQRTTATITCDKLTEVFEAKGEMVEFDGFLTLYRAGSDDDEEATDGLLPKLKVGEQLACRYLEARETFSRPKGRYTEASLVRQLEEMGIGRPSTYAPIVGHIQDREYVQKGDVAGQERSLTVFRLEGDKLTQNTEIELAGAERGKLVPTALGILVCDFLVTNFQDIMNYTFTAKVEEQFDHIAEGEERWQQMIAQFYGPFHLQIGAAENVSRAEAAGARELGTDPKTGKPVSARWGRYGPMVQLGSAEDEEKPRFAGLPPSKRLEEVTLEEALELLKLPRHVADTPTGEPILANFGRFGPYIKFGTFYVSIKPDDPFSLTPERAQQLAAEKAKTEAERLLKSFPKSSIQVLNGRWGPYLTDGKKNAKLPADNDLGKLTLAEAKKLLAAAPVRRRRAKRVK